MTKREGQRHGRRMMRRAAPLLVAFLLGPGVARAADRDATPRLGFEAFLYAWVPGTYGSVEVGDTTVRLDVTPKDVLELLFDGDALSGAGYFALSLGRFDVFADATGGYMESGATQTIPTQPCCVRIDAEDTVRFVIADFGLGYRLGQWSLPDRERPFTLGAFAGARYAHFANELEADAVLVGIARRRVDVSQTFDWADPLIGVRWAVPIFDPVSLDFRGDVGGFGASSDLTWGLVGTVRWWLPFRPFDSSAYLAAGYRVVAFERSDAADESDMQFRGPLFGAGVVF